MQMTCTIKGNCRKEDLGQEKKLLPFSNSILTRYYCYSILNCVKCINTVKRRDDNDFDRPQGQTTDL